MILLLIKVFLSRICDVSLNTVRTMYVIKGNKYIASLIAFVEILIWFYAAKMALSSTLPSILIAISYALGYSTGTLIGSYFYEHVISGIYTITVISKRIGDKEINKIKKNKFGVTIINTIDNKKMLLIEINKKRYKECINLIKKLDKDAFLIVNEVFNTLNGYIKTC